MKKLNVKWALVIAMLTFMAACLFSDKIQREVSANEEIPVEDITPYKTPTGDVRKFLGMWMTSGYNLQPQPNNYTVVDSPTTLRTDSGRSLWTAITSLFAPAHYQWYETTDGKKWTSISKKNGGTKKNLTVTPTEIGTKYYQQEVEWYFVSSLLAPSVYSKVAAIHALDKHVSATDIKVSVDDEYLYNYESEITTTSTYAHATVTPANFTGDIKWSIDNTDLATIDEDSGLITANSRTKSGIVTITGTAVNNDGTTVSDNVEVTVGGGLEDQTVKAGETAEFKMMGNIGEFEEQEDMNYTIRWFKEDPITHEQSEIEIGKNSVSHTTPKTTLNDDGTLFFAYITVKANNKTYEYTTNEATLHVLPDGGPDITLDDVLENKTYNNTSDNSTSLYDVNRDDEVVFKTDIINNSSSGQLKDASYNLPLRAGTTINKVTLDDQEISDADYEVKTDSDTGELTLVVKNINLGIHKTISLVVDTKISDVNKRETYRSIGYLVGKDDSGADVQKISAPRSLNLTTNKLEYKVKNIDYGSIKPIGNDQVIFRQNNESNWPDNVMDIDDMRRDKTPITLSVSQDSDFVSEDNKSTLAGHLKFFDEDYEQDLLTGSAIISQTESGQEMTSLSWQSNKGVLLELDNKKLNASGNYATKLNWVFTDSI